ncbi:MAG: UDP-N-acetylglucosamine--N-acetylmuramyl-(pentapeptide) pyrophosphoryl-undecaprenol N-acetylglucosamine transferase [Rickettsiales bacterium]|jgi:UDP-N-acetylglucosamine--N-acetylmuramyl-(pentapeptide) pyrophosphoryl-undecaprenol N-acetylglucosamine transferase|nr:UDP-N-acetylglucosamine--N-acetylmuramyl-(pentapeptide) pyrophosphoryl-undecaprenol N-acetylglucosamine transferase [Rickettsiales bacterium]
MKKNIKFFLATGGTGGHVFPAIAVATELVRRGYRVTLSSDARGIANVRKNLPAGVGRAYVWASGVGAKSKLKQAWSLLKIGVSAAAYILRFAVLRPDRVIAFGGYSSVPILMAAHVWKIPTLLHEQNAHIGRANAFALRWTDILMTSFRAVAGIKDKGTKGQKDKGLKIIYTGLPVRSDFLSDSHSSLCPSVPLSILITGGSQGAQILDAVVPSSFILLPSSLRKKLFVVHQTRPDNAAALQSEYEKIGVRASVVPFIRDMAETMASSSIVISRAGASTIAELQALGRPAILVPLEINPDQVANAAVLAKQGGAIVARSREFTPKWLSATLTELFENPARLEKMAARAKLPNTAVENIIKTAV